MLHESFFIDIDEDLLLSVTLIPKQWFIINVHQFSKWTGVYSSYLLFTKNNKPSLKRRNNQADEWNIHICFRMWKDCLNIDDADIKHLL